MVCRNACWVLMWIFLFGCVGNGYAEVNQVPQELGAAVRAAIDETPYGAVWQTNDGSPVLAGHPGSGIGGGMGAVI